MTVTETTPGAITGTVSDFAALLGTGTPRFVDVLPDRHGVFGSCWRGVDRKVSVDGGTRVCGWTIWEMPDVYLTAEFHSVWADDTGRLVDITPKPDGEANILFLPDPAYGSDFDFHGRPNNRLHPAYVPIDRPTVGKARIGRFTLAQYRYESGRASKAGVGLLEWITAKVPGDPRHGKIDEFISVMEELHRLTVVRPQGTILPRTERALLLVRRQSALKAALGI